MKLTCTSNIILPYFLDYLFILPTLGNHVEYNCFNLSNIEKFQ